MPELSMYEISARFNSSFLCPLAARSRMLSRKVLAPSPKVMRPTASTTVTSPTCRVVNFTLTGFPPFHSSTRCLRSCFVLNHSDFGALRLPKGNFKFVHERPHQHHTASREPQQIFVRQRIRHRRGIETLALVGDRNRDPAGGSGHLYIHLLPRVIPIADRKST